MNTSQLLPSTNVNIISGAVENIEGITVLYSTTGGTGPEEIIPKIRTNQNVIPEKIFGIAINIYSRVKFN